MNFKEFFTGTLEEKRASAQVQKLRAKPELSANKQKQLEAHVALSRRKFIRLGVTGAAGLAVAATGLRSVFRDPEAMQKMELPQYKLQGPLKDPALIRDYFLPENHKPEKWPAFEKNFLESLNQLEKALQTEKEATARADLLGKFIGSIAGDYFLLTGSHENQQLVWGSKELFDLTRKINRALTPLGYFMNFAIAPYEGGAKEKQIRFSMHRIDRVEKLEIEWGGRHLQVPVVYLGTARNYNADSEAEINPLNGGYVPDQNKPYIMIDEPGALKQYKDVSAKMAERVQRAGGTINKTAYKKEELMNVTLAHESMHAGLDRLKGVDPNKTDRMLELHEMIACGYGLMHSGESAPLILQSIVGSLTIPGMTSYFLAGRTAVQELLQSSGVSDADRDLLMSGTEYQLDNGAKIINALPPATLHLIGGRMVKKGLDLLVQ